MTIPSNPSQVVMVTLISKTFDISFSYGLVEAAVTTQVSMMFSAGIGSDGLLYALSLGANVVDSNNVQWDFYWQHSQGLTAGSYDTLETDDTMANDAWGWQWTSSKSNFVNVVIPSGWIGQWSLEVFSTDSGNNIPDLVSHTNGPATFTIDSSDMSPVTDPAPASDTPPPGHSDNR